MKRCVFINLASAVERRRSVETSFAAADHGDWRLQRFEALRPADIAQVPGSLSPAEKACFASHRQILAESLEDEDPLFIVEDDALFARHAFGIVDAFLAQGHGWDLIYGDVALSNLALMMRLAKRREAMVRQGQFEIVDLAGQPYFGASAYAVAGPAKRRLHDLLAREASLDEAYDIRLARLAGDTLRAGVIFPYPTSLAAHAGTSQIQGDMGAISRSLDAYRRLMFLDRDLDASLREADRLTADYADPQARVLGAIFGAISSAAFPSDS